MKNIKIIVILLVLFSAYSCNKGLTTSRTEKIKSDDIKFGEFESNKKMILTKFNVKIKDDLDEILDKKFTFQIQGSITGNNLLIKNCDVIDITKENNKYYIFISTLWSNSLLKLKSTKEIVDKIVKNDNELPYDNFLIINLSTFNEVKLKYKLEPECIISDWEENESGDFLEGSIELDKCHILSFERTYYGEGKLVQLEF